MSYPLKLLLWKIHIKKNNTQISEGQPIKFFGPRLSVVLPLNNLDKNQIDKFRKLRLMKN
jgi:hypothetical protein